MLAMGVGWSGCFLSNQSRLDEQKDPHFLAGRSRKMAMDYAGAEQAFERALETNPRSASAHLELGLLCYENLNDWAAAIYHFERYLKLNPASNKADAVRQFITVCKQELAKGLPLTSLNQQVQRELEKMDKLLRENTELRHQIEQLKIQLAPLSAVSNSARVASSEPARLAPAPSRVPLPGVQRAGLELNPEPTRSVFASKGHIVRQGDTLYSIARLHGISLNSLVSANSGLDERRLRPGQTLVIPTR
jgi:tetratricopeptide (TPR) repeat protein